MVFLTSPENLYIEWSIARDRLIGLLIWLALPLCPYHFSINYDAIPWISDDGFVFISVSSLDRWTCIHFCQLPRPVDMYMNVKLDVMSRCLWPVTCIYGLSWKMMLVAVCRCIIMNSLEYNVNAENNKIGKLTVCFLFFDITLWNFL